MNNMNLSQEGPIYTHTKFGTSECVNACTAAKNMKGACMLPLISPTTYIQSEKLKKGPLLI